MKFKKYFAIISATALMSTLLSLPMLTSAQPTGTPPNNNTPDATFNSVQSGGLVIWDQATIDSFIGIVGVIAQGTWLGIAGGSDVGYGVYGGSNSGVGVVGESATGNGVYGGSNSGVGVVGESATGTGIMASSLTQTAIIANSDTIALNAANYAGTSQLQIFGSNGDIFNPNSAVRVSDNDGFQVANDAVTVQLSINGSNGDISDPVGAVTVSDSDGLTVSNLIQNANSGLFLSRATGGWLRITPDVTAGAYNPMVSAGDFLLAFSTGAVDTGNLVIGPWTAAVKGIKILGASGNVGIGTTAPSYRLDVASVASLVAQFTNSTAASNDSYIRVSELTGSESAILGSTNGVGFTGSQSNTPFAIRTNNSDKVYVTTSGDVGIGTTAPTEKLHVESGNITAPSGWVASGYSGTDDTIFSALYNNGAIFGNGIRLDAPANGGMVMNLTSPGGLTINSCTNLIDTTPVDNNCDAKSGNAGLIINSQAGGMTINTNTGGLTIASNVSASGGGIALNTYTGGISNLLQPTIAGSTGMPVSISSGDCTTNGGVAGTTCNLPVRIQDNLHVTGTTRLDGNVGIGTSAPTARLDVAAPSTTDPTVTLGRATGQPTIKADTGWLIMDSTGIGAAVNYYDTANVVLAYGAGAGGNVGIGTNAPTRKLDVSKTTCGASCELARLAGSSKAITVFGDGWVGINLPSATNPSYNLHVNGSVAGTGAYNALSDIRYKKDLEKISSALSKVLKLNGYVFDWNNEKYPEMNFKEGKDIGFIAQEVEKVVPEIVSKDNGGYMSLAYGSFTPILTEAIKELNTIVENWGTRVVALEKENAELKAKVEGLEERLERLEAMMK